MKKIYQFLALLTLACSVSLQGFAQEKSEIKFTTTKSYGESLSMWPKSTSKADTIRVDWGDGIIKKYNIDPKGAPFFSKVNGKIMGDTIRIFTQLVKLDCANAGINSFYATNQPLLEDLSLSQNELTSDNIDLSGAKNLKLLSINENQLTIFDARPFEHLEFFNANENPNLSTALFFEGSEHLRSISMNKCDVSHFYPVSLPKLEAISVSYGSLMDMEIGEYYPSLSSLDVSHNYIQEIDVTSCSKLQTFNCTSNFMKKVNVTANPELINLFCEHNELKEINLSNNPKITSLSCSNNKLTHLDVSKLPTLVRLVCDSNNISRLDLSQNSKLNRLTCKNNNLEFLDFAGAPRMDYIDCRYNNKMTSHTVNYMFSTLLGRYSDAFTTNLYVEGCNAEHSNTEEMNTTDMKWKTDIKGDGTAKFSNVNITVNPSVNGTFTLSQPTEYGKKYKDITTSAVIGTPIKVTSKPDTDYAFESVTVNGEVITDTLFVIEKDATIEVNFKSTKKPQMALGVKKDAPLSFSLMAAENNTEITIDWGDGTPVPVVIGKKMTRVDGFATGNTMVITGNVVEADFSSYPEMGLWDNHFTSLTVSNHDKLEALNTYMNPIKSLDVKGCSNLLFLDCSYSELTSLNVKNNDKLLSLMCYGNELQTLDVTNCPELVILNAKSNLLTEIDLSKNSMIESLDLQNNAVTKLSVSHMTELTDLAVAYNKLTELDVTNNPELHVLNASGNQLTELNLTKNLNLGKLLCADNNISKLDLSNQKLIYYVDCQSNKMTACALNDLYYSLPEYPTLETPLKGNTLWVRGTDPKTMNDAEHAESIIASGKGWVINAEGDGSGCDEAYITILETNNGSIKVFTEDGTPVLSGNKVKKNSILKVEATPAEGYEVVKILANGKQAVDGKFTVLRATDVTARFAVASGVSAVETLGIVVSGAKGAIKIVSENSANATVFTMNGKQVAQQSVGTNGHIALAAGTYLVKVQTEKDNISKLVIVF